MSNRFYRQRNISGYDFIQFRGISHRRLLNTTSALIYCTRPLRVYYFYWLATRPASFYLAVIL
jgi:hypothetical protein